MLDKPLSVIVIALYCFLSALFFMSLATEGLYHHMSVFSTTDFGLWLTVVGPIVCMVTAVILGIGVLQLNKRCWMALFYVLLTCVSTFSSMFVASLLLVFVSHFLTFQFFSIFNMPFIDWKLCLFYFSSQAVILYYLTHQDTRGYFGE